MSAERDAARRKFLLAAGIPVLAASFILSLTAGSSSVTPVEALRVMLGQGSEKAAMILTSVRLPRTLAAACVGAGLSTAGLLLQSALNNTLASPGVLGINSGAGLFVLLAAFFFPYQPFVKSLMAFFGALLATVILYAVCAKTGISKSSLLLAGIALSSVFSAFIDILITIRPETVADRAAFSLGGFTSVSAKELMIALPVTITGLILTLFLAPDLDVLLLSDETAHGLGLNVARARRRILVLSSLLCAAAVSIAGLVSFIGIIIPNLFRKAAGGSTRTLAVLCILYGSSFLLVCDTLSRIIAYPYELPVGLLMSCIGAPIFIWILIRRKKYFSAV